MKPIFFTPMVFFYASILYASKSQIRCITPVMPHVNLFLQSNDPQIIDAISVLLESKEPVYDTNNTGLEPSDNAFLNDHVHKISRLNPQSALILTASILKASSTQIHQTILREEWDQFIETPHAVYDKTSRQQFVHRIFQRKDEDSAHPYIDSLSLRAFFVLTEDPHYQSVLTLRMSKEAISGFLSYQPGEADFFNERIPLKNAYIFFETYHYIYVFQIVYRNPLATQIFPESHLSTNVLVFHKKQSDMIAKNLYDSYLEGLQEYFRAASATENIPEPVNNLKITIVSENNSNSLDRLINRLEEVEKVFGHQLHFTIRDTILRYNNIGQKDLQISTIIKIAHWLGVDFEILLSDRNLIPYVQLDENRQPLSSDYIYRIETFFKRHLMLRIDEYGLSQAQLAERSGVPYHIIKGLISNLSLPKYLILERIVNVLETSISDILNNAMNDMSQTAEHAVRNNNQIDSQNTFPDRGAKEFIRNRILEAMSLAGLGSSENLHRILKIHKADFFHHTDFSLKTLLRTSVATKVKLSTLLSHEDMEDQIHPINIDEVDTLSEDYFDKARRLIIYYIKRRMVELNLSIRDISSSISSTITLKETTIRAILHNRVSNIRYLSLNKIAMRLDTTLPDLVKTLEEDIARFNDLNLDITIPTNSHGGPNYNHILNTWRERMLTGLELSQISRSQLKHKFRIDLDRLREYDLQVRTIFQVANILQISVEELLGSRDLATLIPESIDIASVKRLDDSQLQGKIDQLNQNIRIELEQIYGTNLPLHVERQIATWGNIYIYVRQILQMSRDLDVIPIRFFQGL